MKFSGAVFALSLIVAAVAGCSGESDNRTVNPAESAAADAKRQEMVDNMNIPESQKAAMKAHMGGPPAADPGAAARAKAAASQSGRRN
ncbi:hypothetical protein [Fimbriimonas ginsengisoli]|uniref:Lipoprotein n=1 Tax=Fimbriimonas ginsengisoli Gsoil 348 TaxID=661478 RepID=A0A068NPS8_FIMGI|nr:hypothetical protein [Fimbriimonas ginsengisoli]AIE84770.1 hypothetical protein OP10G_1402 [Fimbriimonas ginsengisoli Gsoil 348]